MKHADDNPMTITVTRCTVLKRGGAATGLFTVRTNLGGVEAFSGGTVDNPLVFVAIGADGIVNGAPARTVPARCRIALDDEGHLRVPRVNPHLPPGGLVCPWRAWVSPARRRWRRAPWRLEHAVDPCRDRIDDRALHLRVCQAA